MPNFGVWEFIVCGVFAVIPCGIAIMCSPPIIRATLKGIRQIWHDTKPNDNTNH